MTSLSVEFTSGSIAVTLMLTPGGPNVVGIADAEFPDLTVVLSPQQDERQFYLAEEMATHAYVRTRLATPVLLADPWDRATIHVSWPSQGIEADLFDVTRADVEVAYRLWER